MTAPSDAKLLSCREVDRIYRMASGTARKAFHARKLKGLPRGKTIFIKPEHAERLFGIA